MKNYIEGLTTLKELYDDEEYLSFVDDLSKNEYIAAFIKTSSLTILRGVDESKILKTKGDICQTLLILETALPNQRFFKRPQPVLANRV